MAPTTQSANVHGNGHIVLQNTGNGVHITIGQATTLLADSQESYLSGYQQPSCELALLVPQLQEIPYHDLLEADPAFADELRQALAAAGPAINQTSTQTGDGNFNLQNTGSITINK